MMKEAKLLTTVTAVKERSTKEAITCNATKCTSSNVRYIWDIYYIIYTIGLLHFQVVTLQNLEKSSESEYLCNAL